MRERKRERERDRKVEGEMDTHFVYAALVHLSIRPTAHAFPLCPLCAPDLGRGLQGRGPAAVATPKKRR